MNKILVVDDEKNIILVFKMSLEKAGYDVVIARDGIVALEKAREENPDLILLDIVLPKMNGFLVFEALQDDPKTEEIPVIFLSARAEKKDLDKAMSMGATDYLVKPLKQHELLEAVEKYIKEEQ